LKAGIEDSPTCTDCHGEHHILSPKGPESQTHARNVAAQTCGACHDDPRIIVKYGLRSGVVGSYADSYHGWAVARDHERAATCVSCHGSHAVLPASDPGSQVSPERVVETCAQCHPAANAAFAESYSHLSASITANPINLWIRRFYLALIAVVIGGMALHNAFILAWFARRRRRHLAGEAALQRLSPAERLQHACLALSFTGLVVTGFALRFPESWWAVELTRLGMDEPLRQQLHRGFGLVMMVLALFHLAWGLASRYGREALVAMWPRWSDLGEAAQNLRFHAGRGERPRFGRFDYTQKAEYWALVWGTVLMALTGLVLWFPEWAVRLVPSWVVPASQTIHYYEAWLATLAIVVWHFFFVIFHPDVWPLSWTWLDGRMSEHEAREHHPRWAAEKLAAESRESAD
jgi:formate dehydrogenase gamma subunit